MSTNASKLVLVRHGQSEWNATNQLGQPVSTGVYLYTIEADVFVHTKKMILLK